MCNMTFLAKCVNGIMLDFMDSLSCDADQLSGHRSISNIVRLTHYTRACLVTYAIIWIGCCYSLYQHGKSLHLSIAIYTIYFQYGRCTISKFMVHLLNRYKYNYVISKEERQRVLSKHSLKNSHRHLERYISYMTFFLTYIEGSYHFFCINFLIISMCHKIYYK